jgi:C4-dicarboxylate-specific signal transduction histidine kinase
MTRGFPNEFSQVILNILINARDALLERKTVGPRISVTVVCKSDSGIITVADNAGGIPNDCIGKVFDPYFTTKEIQKGTGLGLYMAKTIIEKNMNGILTVANGKDGAEFCIEVENVHQQA